MVNTTVTEQAFNKAADVDAKYYHILPYVESFEYIFAL